MSVRVSACPQVKLVSDKDRKDARVCSNLSMLRGVSMARTASRTRLRRRLVNSRSSTSHKVKDIRRVEPTQASTVIGDSHSSIGSNSNAHVKESIILFRSCSVIHNDLRLALVILFLVSVPPRSHLSSACSSIRRITLLCLLLRSVPFQVPYMYV